MKMTFKCQILIYKISIIIFYILTINCIKSTPMEVYPPNHQPHNLKSPAAEDLKPYFEDCRKYLRNFNGNLYLQSCPPGTVFNVELKQCDVETKTDCAGRGYFRNATYEEANLNIACPFGDTGLHPYPNDCDRFIECSEGRLNEKYCSDGTGFNTKIAICDHKYNLQCGWKNTDSHQSSRHTADILCTKNAAGAYFYPFDFAKYINCTNAQTWIQNCPQDTKFSITKGYCVASADIEMRDFVKYKLPFDNILVYEYLYTCPHDVHYNHLYPFDEAKFIKCSNGQLLVVSCGSNEVFSKEEQGCVAPSNVLPPSNPDHEDIIYCSLDLFGLFPHPFDNTKYLKCVYGRLYILSCRSGYVYSLSRKFCDIKKEIRSFDTLPAIQNLYKEESQIEIRSSDNLTYIKCPLDLNGSFAYPFDCTKYLKCSQGATVIKACSNDHMYSIWNEKCQPRSQVDENDHVECLEDEDQYNISKGDFSLGVFCSPKGSSQHPHPQNWHYYVQCNNGKLSVERCPRNHVFSIKTRKCIEEPFQSDGEE